MPNYISRERPYRQHSRMREEPKPDTVTVALTAQIIVCVLLLVCAFGMKKLDEAKFNGIKSQYASMLKDENHTDKAIEWFSDSEGVFGGIFGTFERYISGILPSKPKPAKIIEAEDEPEDEPAAGQGQQMVLQFDYLSNKDIAYMASNGSAGMISPPSGSTLSPVYLGAKIKPPVTGAITSDFAYRYHPLTGKNDFHTGIDIAAEEGRPILAALPGEVVEVGWSEIYGNYIVLQHAINLRTSYSHCSQIIAREGMAVRQGERIALVGETGAATGPHLHFSVIVEGEFSDPAWVLKDYIKLVE